METQPPQTHSTPKHVEVSRVPGTAITGAHPPVGGPIHGAAKISTTRFVLAFIVAVVSDAASIATEFVPPIQWVVDGVTALLLFALLGRRWQILPGLIAEAVPGLAALPFWILVVLAVFASQRAGRGKAASAATR